MRSLTSCNRRWYCHDLSFVCRLIFPSLLQYEHLLLLSKRMRPTPDPVDATTAAVSLMLSLTAAVLVAMTGQSVVNYETA